MKSIVKMKDLTIICDEVYGNSVQAQLGLNFVTSMPKHRGLIFYLAKPVTRMVTDQMKFEIETAAFESSCVRLQISSKVWIEMNLGLMKEYGIVDGTPVTVERVLDGDVNCVGDRPEIR